MIKSKRENILEKLEPIKSQEDIAPKLTKIKPKEENILEKLEPINSQEDITPKLTMIKSKRENILEKLEPINSQEDIAPKLTMIKQKKENILEKLEPINSQEDIAPKLTMIKPKQQNILEKLEPIKSQQNISSEFKLIKVKKNISSKVELNQVNYHRSKPIFQSNSTHLWNMRVTNEKYVHLEKVVPCRAVEYDIGLPSTSILNSCDPSSKNQFSIQTTLNAQKWIFNHQNPSNCNDKKFAIINSLNQSDFAYSIQLITWAFAKALTQNRIALYATPSNWVKFIFYLSKQFRRILKDF
jgi:hypothetical protein